MTLIERAWLLNCNYQLDPQLEVVVAVMIVAKGAAIVVVLGQTPMSPADIRMDTLMAQPPFVMGVY